MFKSVRTAFLDRFYLKGCPVYCAWCFSVLTRKEATIDHNVPIASGGRVNSKTNLLISCQPCNQARGRDVSAKHKVLFIWDNYHWILKFNLKPEKRKSILETISHLVKK